MKKDFYKVWWFVNVWIEKYRYRFNVEEKMLIRVFICKC